MQATDDEIRRDTNLKKSRMMVASAAEASAIDEYYLKVMATDMTPDVSIVLTNFNNRSAHIYLFC